MNGAFLAPPPGTAETLLAAEYLDEMEADASLVLDGLAAGYPITTELLDARLGPLDGVAPRTVVRAAVTALMLGSDRLRRLPGQRVAGVERYVARYPEPSAGTGGVGAGTEPTTPQPAEDTSAPEPMDVATAHPAADTSGVRPPITLPPLGGVVSPGEIYQATGLLDKTDPRRQRLAGAVTAHGHGAGRRWTVDAALVGALEAEGYLVEHETPSGLSSSADANATTAAIPLPDSGEDGADSAAPPAADAGDGQAGPLPCVDVHAEFDQVEREGPAIDEPRVEGAGDTVVEDAPVALAPLKLADLPGALDELRSLVVRCVTADLHGNDSVGQRLGESAHALAGRIDAALATASAAVETARRHLAA